MPLSVYSFTYYPIQTITDYDASGEPTGESRQLSNVTMKELQHFHLLNSPSRAGNFAPVQPNLDNRDRANRRNQSAVASQLSA